MRNSRAAAWLAVTLGPAAAAHAQAQGYEYGPGMMGAYGWAHGSAFGMVGMVLWWVLIILGIALLARWLIKGAPGAETRPAVARSPSSRSATRAGRSTSSSSRT